MFLAEIPKKSDYYRILSLVLGSADNQTKVGGAGFQGAFLLHPIGPADEAGKRPLLLVDVRDSTAIRYELLFYSLCDPCRTSCHRCTIVLLAQYWRFWVYRMWASRPSLTVFGTPASSSRPKVRRRTPSNCFIRSLHRR